jgi:hypothetical protein
MFLFSAGVQGNRLKAVYMKIESIIQNPEARRKNISNCEIRIANLKKDKKPGYEV